MNHLSRSNPVSDSGKRSVVPLLSRAVRWMLCLALLSLTGCENLQTEYGKSQGAAGRKSIAGFAVMREYYRRRGWKDRQLTLLSERQNSLNTIVWTPSVNVPPQADATDWLDQWLAQGDRTLIWVLRDHQTVDAYWQQAATVAPPQQRLEYRRRLARARMEKLQTLLTRSPTLTNGWFTATATQPPVPLGATRGPWSEAVPGLPASRQLEFSIRAFDKTTDKNQNPPPTAFVFGRQGTDAIVDRETQVESLLKTSGGETVVAKVTAQPWDNSQVLVIAGGSLLNNFGLLEPESRRLLAALEQASLPAAEDEPRKVGFAYTDEYGLRISSLNPDEMGPTGMEALTEAPINLPTTHGLFCGFLFCLMLFPIVGRPRRLPRHSTGDFKDHLDAVAGLMAKTQGEQYARVRISEYMVRVRGEDEGPWVIPADEVSAMQRPAATTQASPTTVAVPDEPRDGAPASPSPPGSDPSESSRQHAAGDPVNADPAEDYQVDQSSGPEPETADSGTTDAGTTESGAPDSLHNPSPSDDSPTPSDDSPRS